MALENGPAQEGHKNLDFVAYPQVVAAHDQFHRLAVQLLKFLFRQNEKKTNSIRLFYYLGA